MMSAADTSPGSLVLPLEKLLQHREHMSSHDVAVKTLDLLMRVISNTKWSNAQELLDTVRREGGALMTADPSELIIGSMVRRCLKIIRDEYKNAFKKEGENTKENELQRQLLGSETTYTKLVPNLKGNVCEALTEAKSEIDSAVDNIASQALEHIHAEETVMTMGYSRTVETFLKYAARKRKFTVIIAETSPSFIGHDLAKSLADTDINTILITDMAVNAMISRVNKVIIGCHSIMANGGIKALCGSDMMARSARYHKVPVLVLAPMYKLSTEYWHDDKHNKYRSPEVVLGKDVADFAGEVTTISPVFEFVEHELITLFIFNTGGNAPSYTYNLIKELYPEEDAGDLTRPSRGKDIATRN